MIKQLIAGLVVLAALILVLTPKTKLTCTALLSFICALGLVAWQSLSYCLKPALRTAKQKMKRLIFTEGREWLDETEQQITE